MMRRPMEERLYLNAVYQFKRKLAHPWTLRNLRNHNVTVEDALSLYNELITTAIRKYKGGMAKWYTFVNVIINNTFSKLVGRYNDSHKYNHVMLSEPVHCDEEGPIELIETLPDTVSTNEIDRIFDKEELEWAISKMEDEEIRDYFLEGITRGPNTYRKVAKFRENLKRDYEKRYMAVYSQ